MQSQIIQGAPITTNIAVQLQGVNGTSKGSAGYGFSVAPIAPFPLTFPVTVEVAFSAHKGTQQMVVYDDRPIYFEHRFEEIRLIGILPFSTWLVRTAQSPVENLGAPARKSQDRILVYAGGLGATVPTNGVFAAFAGFNAAYLQKMTPAEYNARAQGYQNPTTIDESATGYVATVGAEQPMLVFPTYRKVTLYLETQSDGATVTVYKRERFSAGDAAQVIVPAQRSGWHAITGALTAAQMKAGYTIDVRDDIAGAIGAPCYLWFARSAADVAIGYRIYAEVDV